jgi:hypothetical protein
MELDAEVGGYRGDPADGCPQREQPERVLRQPARGHQRDHEKRAFTGDVRQSAIGDQGRLLSPQAHSSPRVMTSTLSLLEKPFPAP